MLSCSWRLEELAVFAAPLHPVAGGQLNGLFHRLLPIFHGTFQVAALNAVLHADVARVIFAIDKRSAVALLDVWPVPEWNLLAVRRSHQQIANLLRATAELRLHAHDKIEQLFALHDLRRGLPTDGRLDHGFDVGDIDAVARDLLAVDIDEQAWLSQLANTVSSVNPGTFCSVFLICRPCLRALQIGP